MKRRTEAEMLETILQYAREDERVRAVALAGSRVMPDAKPDKYRDFDITFLVTDVHPFTKGREWIGKFGEMLILQTPDDWYSHPYDYSGRENFAYLMQFADGNRIDLTLVDKVNWHRETPAEEAEPRRVLLNKDGLEYPDVPGEGYYHLERPEEKEFLDTCNEFWWLALYVAKALCRRELTLAKHMLDEAQYPMFFKMLCWKIGLEKGFQVSVGKRGKYLERFLAPEEWKRFAGLFASGDYEEMWRSLLGRCDWFQEMAPETAKQLGYPYRAEEGRRVREFAGRMQEGK